MAKLWRYIAGERGVNRVRVYERRKGGPLQLEWYDRDGRHQRSLTKLFNIPLLGGYEEDRKLAMQIADRMSEELRKKRHEQKVRTLKGLLIDSGRAST